MEQIKRFFKDEEGITFAETGLYLALVVLGITALGALTGGLNDIFNKVGGDMKTAAS